MFALDLFNTKYEKELRAGAVDKVVSEGGPYDLPGKDYDRPGDAPRKPRSSGGTAPRRHPDDPDFMDPDQRRLRADQERVRKANAEYHTKKNQGVAEGWKEESQDLEDWSKEVNMRLYRAHPSQRLALGKQLSNIEHKHFGSEIELFKNGKQGYTRIVSATLNALQSGDMVHYDPGKVGAMPFGSIVGDDAKEIAAANLHASESEGYGILKRNRIVDTVNDFLRLVDVVRSLPPEYLFKYKDAGGQAWFEIVKDIRWSKDDAPGKKYRVSQGVAEGIERAVDAKGRTQSQWIQLVKAKFPNAKIMQAKMIDGPVQVTLPDGRQLGWSKVEQAVAEDRKDREFFNNFEQWKAARGKLHTDEDRPAVSTLGGKIIAKWDAKGNYGWVDRSSQDLDEERKPYGDYQQSPRAFGAGNFQRVVRANMGNLPTVTLEFADPNDNIVLDRKGVDLISDYYDGLENDSLKNHFIYRVLPSADEVLTILQRLGWHEAVQPELPGIPKQGELPLQEKKRSDRDLNATVGDTKVARELQKLRAQYPAARNDVEVVAKSEIDSNERSQQQLAAIDGANTEQDQLLKQLVALDRKQGKEIGSLDNENDRLEQHLKHVEQTNAKLAQAIGQMGGETPSKGADDAGSTRSKSVNLAPADAPAQAQAKPEPSNTKTKSDAINRMAQDLTQPRKVKGINSNPPPASIRFDEPGNVTDISQHRANLVRRAQSAIKDKDFKPLAKQLVNKGVVTRTGTDDKLDEFAPGQGGGSGNYFQALASAWYNGAFDTGSLQKGIKSKEDVERLLNRGIVAPDGKIRKYAIDYNSDFDGVVISSDDYYEHADYNDQGQEVDSRTGQKWGPYDYMEFGDSELDEGVVDTLKGSWEKVKNFDSPARSTSNTQRYQDLRKQQELKRKQIKNQVPVNELSTDKLAQYKTAAALDAGAADKRGDYERGDKRFAGIVKATKKQFANDLKKHGQQGVAEGSSTASDAVERAILNRIMVQHTDLLMRFGPDKVMQAAEEVAYGVGDVDEIGTSDVSAYVNQVRQILGA